jgi:hypothetical protein
MRLLRKFAVVAAGVAFLGSMGPLSFAKPSGSGPAKGNPKGNNGTVKVDGVPFDELPNNEPHVGCAFQIDFYGFDQGNLYANVTFAGQPPTGGGTLLSDTVFIGGDPAGGGTDLDASRTYDLRGRFVGIQPHPKQGYHVKLTVHADGSRGADVKHKVFWVSGCDPASPPPPPGGGGGGGSNPPPSNGPPPTAPPARPVDANPSFTG